MGTGSTPAPPRAEARDTILAAYPPDGADRKYVQALAALVGPAPSPPTPAYVANPLLEAQAAFRKCDYDGAFELLQRAPPDRERFVFSKGFCVKTIVRKRNSSTYRSPGLGPKSASL